MIATKEPRETPRSRLRQWFEAKIEGLDEFNVAEIEEEATREFFSDTAWVHAMFGPMLRTQLRELVGQMRPHSPILGNTVTKRDSKTMEERVTALSRKWGQWIEAVPDGGYVRLLAMTRPQLIQVAAARTAVGNEQLRVAALLSEIANRLTNDTEQVRDRFTPQELEWLEQDI